MIQEQIKILVSAILSHMRAFGFAFLSYFVFFSIVFIIQAFLLYKSGNKTKYKHPWFAFVPLLNIIMYAQLAGFPFYIPLLLIVPHFRIAVVMVMFLRFCLNFGVNPKKLLLYFALMFSPYLKLIIILALIWECAYSKAPYKVIELKNLIK